MDPVLEPVLAKAFIKRGNQILIAIGDKEVDYNPDFKLYITTKLSNPHYTPEVSTKAMILNFAVKVLPLASMFMGQMFCGC
jgi:dynein heavy chain, axonemal